MTQLVNQRLNNQQIFDNALFGIRSQDYQQSLNGQHCAYRGTSDTGSALKCAVGWNISDEDGQRWDCGSRTVSGTAIDEMANAFSNTYLKYFTYVQLPLLLDLQRVHDRTLPQGDVFESAMEDIADKYELVYTPVQEG